MPGMSPAAVAWTKLTREERQAILAQRWADAKAKNEAKKKKEADDKFMREHPNALVRVVTQEEADQRNAAMARRPKAWHELDAKLGIVRTPVEPGLVRPAFPDYKPPDPALGVPGPSQPESLGDKLLSGAKDAGAIGACGFAGQIVGGVVGQALIPIPVVGEQIGQGLGAILGGLAGFAFAELTK